MNDFNGMAPVLGLVGLRGEVWPWVAIQRAWKDFAESGTVDYPSLLVEDLWAAHLLDGGSATAGQTGRVNTLNNLLVEVDAGRERVTGTPTVKYLWGLRWLDFLEMHGRVIEGLPASWQGGAERAREMTALSFQAGRDFRLREQNRMEMSGLLPLSARDRQDLDWTKWPALEPNPTER